MALEPQNPAHVLDVADAAPMLKLSKATVYRLIERGVFPSPVLRLGDRILILRVPFEELLRSGNWQPPELADEPTESERLAARKKTQLAHEQAEIEKATARARERKEAAQRKRGAK